MQKYCEELSKVKKKHGEKAGGCKDSQSKRDKDNRYASCRDLSVRTRDVSLAVRLLLHHSKFKGAG